MLHLAGADLEDRAALGHVGQREHGLDQLQRPPAHGLGTDAHTQLGHLTKHVRRGRERVGERIRVRHRIEDAGRQILPLPQRWRKEPGELIPDEDVIDEAGGGHLFGCLDGGLWRQVSTEGNWG